MKEGDTLALQIALGEAHFRVAGFTRADGTRFGVVDIAGVQAALGRAGRINRLDLRLRDGVDVAAFRARLTASLPPGVLAERPAAGITRAANISRSYRVNLNVLALVALFTGGLLVFTTQALAVVRRRPQFALLRALGMTRRRLARMLLTEARSSARWAPGSVSPPASRSRRRSLSSSAPTSAPVRSAACGRRCSSSRAGRRVFFALGVAVALLASLAPALEAARARPAAALKAGRRAARVRAAAACLARARGDRGRRRADSRAARRSACHSSATSRSRCCSSGRSCSCPGSRSRRSAGSPWRARCRSGSPRSSSTARQGNRCCRWRPSSLRSACSSRWRSWSRRSATRSPAGSTTSCPPTCTSGRPRPRTPLSSRRRTRRRSPRVPGIRRLDFTRVQSILLAPEQPPVVLIAAPGRSAGPRTPARAGRRDDLAAGRCAAAGMGVRGNGRRVRFRARAAS